MEQCRKHQSGYLFGDLILNNPRHLCSQIKSDILVVWVGVRRQKYKHVDQGIYKHLIFIFILEEKPFLHIFGGWLSFTHYVLAYFEIIIPQPPPLLKKIKK